MCHAKSSGNRPTVAETRLGHGTRRRGLGRLVPEAHSGQRDAAHVERVQHRARGAAQDENGRHHDGGRRSGDGGLVVRVDIVCEREGDGAAQPGKGSVMV